MREYRLAHSFAGYLRQTNQLMDRESKRMLWNHFEPLLNNDNKYVLAYAVILQLNCFELYELIIKLNTTNNQITEQ